MRKRVTGDKEQAEAGNWLAMESIAELEVSSEDADHPAENALIPSKEHGWRAAKPGQAHIGLRFDDPINIGRMLVEFEDKEHERSQEWSLHARFADGQERELLRQGWNFSPGGSTTQKETYTLNAPKVVALMLQIDPDRGRNRYPATLQSWRLSAF